MDCSPRCRQEPDRPWLTRIPEEARRHHGYSLLAWLELGDTTSLDTITGPAAGVTIDGGGLGRVFQIDAGPGVSISELTITGGASISNTLTGAVTIYSNAALTLDQCTISGNTGIGVFDQGTARSTNSTISNNTGVVGGIKVFAGVATLTNCTISGNTGTNNGGIAASKATGTSSTVVLTNCTISGNTGTGNTGGVYDAKSTVSLINTIVAGNTGTTHPDVSGTLTSLGHNLIGKTDGSSGWIGSDLTGTEAAPLDPLLAALGNYGGPTQTMALLPGSPAIGAGGSGAGIPPTDERGQASVGALDIGAFESQGFTLTPVVGSTPQFTPPGTAFPNPLNVSVTANNSVEPVNGGVITFTAPSSGASATLSASTAFIGSSGQASVTAKANGSHRLVHRHRPNRGPNAADFA